MFALEALGGIRYDDLGALALLAEIPQDASRDNADVAAIARLAGNPEDLETLDASCATGSFARVADLLHLHRSSVARRLEQIGKTLGIEPTGLTRARFALTAAAPRRLSKTSVPGEGCARLCRETAPEE